MALLHLRNLPGFAQRNPRYVALLAFFLVCSTILLIPPGSYVASKFRGGMSLEELVAEEELRYAAFLDDRHELIRLYGPNPDQVDSCVRLRCVPPAR